MKGICSSIAVGLILSFVLLPRTRAYPAKAAPLQEDDDEEVDSDEQEINQLGALIADRLGVQKNATDQELVDKATTFLAQYFTNPEVTGVQQSEQEAASKGNRTIIITIVQSKNQTENNEAIGGAGGTGVESLGLARYPTEPPAPIPAPQYIANNVGGGGAGGFAVFESLAGGQLPTVSPNRRPVSKPIKQTVDHNENPFASLSQVPVAGLSQYPVSGNIQHPIQNENRVTIQNQENVANQNHQHVAIQNQQHAANQHQLPISSQGQQNSQGVNNIEDAILEALSLAQGESPGSQPPLASQNNAGYHLSPDNVQQVQLQQQQQQQQLTPSASIQDGQLVVDPNQVAQLPVIFVQQYNPEPSTTPRQGPTVFGTFSKIIGSIAEGNLGGAIQNSFRLVQVPELQDSAKLAAGGVLHTLSSGISSGITSGLASGITSGLTSGITSGIGNVLTGGDITTGVASGLSSGIATGLVNGVNCQVLGNCPTLPTHTVFRHSPQSPSYKK